MRGEVRGFAHSERLKNLMLGRTAVVFVDPSPTYEEYWYRGLYDGEHFFGITSDRIILSLQRARAAPQSDEQRHAGIGGVACRLVAGGLPDPAPGAGARGLLRLRLRGERAAAGHGAAVPLRAPAAVRRRPRGHGELP